MTDLVEVHADAALRTALNERLCRPGSRDQRKYLEIAARRPDLIQSEIVRLEAVIELLRDYLPEVPR